MGQHEFEFVGGHPALDFLNTIHDWTADDPRDYLVDFGEAVRFGEAAGILSGAEARRLARRPASGELDRLRGVRALLAEIVALLASGKPPSAGLVRALESSQLDVARASVLRPSGGRLIRKVDEGRAGAGLLRLRLLDAALALLGSPELERVKACPACGWFFLDDSKNRSRRWCSMKTCGSNAKAKRYYWRMRDGSRA